MVNTNGAEHGLDQYADKISGAGDGSYTVKDDALRREILGLRTDPRLNALMAGEYAKDNEAHLERTVGGKIGTTELYLSHFLGAGGAERFPKEMRANTDRRSEGRRVGDGCGRTCRSRWEAYH